MELISRVKAVLRRTQGSADGVLRFQTIEINTKGRVVTVDGVVVNLTFKEFELLVYLMKHTNVVLSREQIMQVVWSFDFEGESRTVDMHIKSLRQKLGEGSVWLHTVRSVGYKIGD